MEQPPSPQAWRVAATQRGQSNVAGAHAASAVPTCMVTGAAEVAGNAAMDVGGAEMLEALCCPITQVKKGKVSNFSHQKSTTVTEARDRPE